VKIPFSDDPYRILNLVFIIIILLVIAYSIYYGTPGREHPIPSGSELLTGKTSISTGLSRSFSAIVRFRFHEARELNPYGIRIFMFFLLQLLMRVSGFFIISKVNRKKFIRADIIVSVLLFIILFWPFLNEILKYSLF
jgi:hypothetical protein